jgi:transaldolase
MIATIATPAVTTNPLQELRKFGVTSNPAIFEKAITGSTDYADALVEPQKRKDLDAMGVYEILAIKDIQDAADILRPVYDESKRRDGYVSLEVSPFLARDTEGTLKDARRLWKAVNRPNLLVKAPATLEGIPAIRKRRVLRGPLARRGKRLGGSSNGDRESIILDSRH